MEGRTLINYFIKRLLLIFPTLLGITLITFFVMKLAPGDPVSLKLMFMGEGISPQAMASELEKQHDPLTLPLWYEDISHSLSRFFYGRSTHTGLEKALTWIGRNAVYYLRWLSNIVHLDFGLSLKDKRPVSERIREALPITLTLNIVEMTIVYFVSIPLGIWSAAKASRTWDKIIMVKLFILYSLPTFWVATMLLVYFAGGEYFNLFPLRGFNSPGFETFTLGHKIADRSWHLVLPILSSVIGSFAFLSRYSRGNFLEVVQQDYMRTARAKGLSEGRVLWKHGFRNALIPFITLVGTLLPALLGGSVIIEQIFSIPGMGMLAFEAVLGRDTNMIMGISTISAFLTLLGLLISDLMYGVADPRISFEGE